MSKDKDIIKFGEAAPFSRMVQILRHESRLLSWTLHLVWRIVVTCVQHLSLSQSQGLRTFHRIQTLALWSAMVASPR